MRKVTMENKGIIHWFSRNHVAANFLMVMILVFGFATWPTLKKEIFPETEVDAINVTVIYPNATPEEVEKGIVIPIEEAIQDVNGVDAIRSRSSQGYGRVTIEVDNGSETREVMDDVKTRVDAI
ncbi:MAG: efflux RND transporter permease subunit, partial [Verrucomicrobiota bacterium]